MQPKAIIHALGVFGLFMHLFVTGALFAIGYFDFLDLRGLTHTASMISQTAASQSQPNSAPLVQAIDAARSVIAIDVSVVTKYIKMLARISLVSFSAYAGLLAYSFWSKRESKVASKTFGKT
jgi:hypothetical protein